jgi:hypothetical protein
LIHDSGKALWECTVKFNKYYSGSNIFGFSGFWNHLELFFSKWWILFLVSALFFLKRPKNWWFYASLLFLALLTTFGSWYGHYYIIFVLFWSVIIAYSVDFLADLVSQKFSFSVSDGENTKKGKLNPAKVRIFLTAAMIFIIMIPSAEFIFSSKEEFSKAKLGGENTFLNSVSASQEIKNMTDSGDYVLVAGSEPQILYYSKRKSPTRFVIFYPLMINTPVSSNYQKEAVEEIKKNPPKIIAYVNSYYSWTPDPNSPKMIIEFLDGLMKEKYDLVEGSSKENQISIYKIK